MTKILRLLPLAFFILLAPLPTSAHEVYVLSKEQVADGFRFGGLNIFDALRTPGNLQTFAIISACVGLALLFNLFFRHSPAGKKWHAFLEKGHVFGPILVRLAVSAAFFYSASTGSFLGPELSLSELPYGEVIRILLYVLSGMFFFGLFVEVAALLGFAIFGVAMYHYGWYMFAYSNYFGEFIVLVLFGLRKYSLDRLLFGPAKRFLALEKYKTTIVRICYGTALGFAAINIKFLHPVLTLAVVNQYDLTQFHWLFPHDPLLLVLGAALSELTIAIFIIIGFQLRFVVFVSLFYITLSLLFFKEAVWPHYLLYGISLNLIFDKEVFTLDNLIDKYWPFRKKAKQIG